MNVPGRKKEAKARPPKAERRTSLAEAARLRRADESPCSTGWNYHVFSLASLNCTMCGASR